MEARTVRSLHASRPERLDRDRCAAPGPCRRAGRIPLTSTTTRGATAPSRAGDGPGKPGKDDA
jgi:hypothetical protein